MPGEAFERRALGEAITERLAGRRVLAAVFTTYSFDPGFFELHVLPLLFARGFSKEDTVRIVQLDEELRSTPVAVYFDRGAVNPGRGGGSLGNHIGIRRASTSGATKGCFHPKLILALVDDGDGAEALVAGALSANLTESGHWTNVECAWIDEVSGDARCSYRDDLLGVLAAVRKEVKVPETKHDALDRIIEFLRTVEPAKQRTQSGRYLPRLFYGQAAFATFLQSELRLTAETYHLEVISPFFDDGRAMRELHAALAPKTTRVFLPLGDDGAAACAKPTFDAIGGLENVAWARFVDPSYLRRSAKGPDDLRRTVHAKVYRLWSKADGQHREFVILGSVNLTGAAHSPRNSGNFEVAVVHESAQPLLRPLLAPIEREPSEFGATSSAREEEPDDREACPLVLRFYWGQRRLTAFWDAPTRSPRLSLQVGGARLPEAIEPLEPGAWVDLPATLAAQVAEHLPRTSLVSVVAPDA